MQQRLLCTPAYFAWQCKVPDQILHALQLLVVNVTYAIALSLGLSHMYMFVAHVYEVAVAAAA